MRRSSLMIALSGLYTANVSARSGAPNYVAIATWLEDFKPTQTGYAAKYGTPTTTVAVAQTIQPQQERHDFASADLGNKPRPDEDEPYLHLKRQSSSSPDSGQNGCEDGPYAGTGACQCSYNILCGILGDCGAADAKVLTLASSWQACGELCDNNSDCTAWVYSYSTGLCTEITDPGCGTDNLQTIEDPDSMLGVYDGGIGCGGVCLI